MEQPRYPALQVLTEGDGAQGDFRRGQRDGRTDTLEGAPRQTIFERDLYQVDVQILGPLQNAGPAFSSFRRAAERSRL